ncbi:hypothetical protein E2C01_013989 [Portunus trituberculatus]|uniref:Uncharacterized protein n=1 Tax=Portunus trituberculatus TaxID=210409 RepID=A0A5B7DIV6_PORTR|nr:hypothetical protein [Portunus trituberculatus]
MSIKIQFSPRFSNSGPGGKHKECNSGVGVLGPIAWAPHISSWMSKLTDGECSRLLLRRTPVKVFLLKKLNPVTSPSAKCFNF